MRKTFHSFIHRRAGDYSRMRIMRLILLAVSKGCTDKQTQPSASRKKVMPIEGEKCGTKQKWVCKVERARWTAITRHRRNFERILSLRKAESRENTCDTAMNMRNTNKKETFTMRLNKHVIPFEITIGFGWLSLAGKPKATKPRKTNDIFNEMENRGWDAFLLGTFVVSVTATRRNHRQEQQQHQQQLQMKFRRKFTA